MSTSDLKLTKLRRLMSDNNVDGVLLSSPINQSYVTDINFDDGYVAVTAEKCIVCVDFRYFEAVKNSLPHGVEVQLAERSALYSALDALLSLNARRIALEGDSISYALFKKISERTENRAELVCDASSMLSRLRAVKDDEELKKIDAAQKLTDAAFEHVLNFISPNATEREIALELEFFMRQNGAEAMAFDVIAVSGKASSLPHGVPRNVKLERGFLTLDFGAKLDGYCSDMTRTVVIGKADAEIKKLYNTVLAAQKAALEKLCEGLSCSEADRIARNLINAADYEGCFGHSLGHGVGRYVHEAPTLSCRSAADLEIGNVVTVEPGIYLEGRYGCRIEDMVAITKDGVYDFTKSSKELIEFF